MTDDRKFDSRRPAEQRTGRLDCAAVESSLAEWAEGAVPDEAKKQMEMHAGECARCREELAQARRGREWLLILKQEVPAPSPDLAAKILAATHGIAKSEGVTAAVDRREPDASKLRAMLSRAGRSGDTRATLPESAGTQRAGTAAQWQRGSLVVLRRTLMEPRVALVAAMAFFSISLTLNLMGVRVTAIRPADFTPRGMRRALTRQYVQADSRVVRYYENLRIVYEVEARVHELRRAAETNPANERDSGTADEKANGGHSERQHARPSEPEAGGKNINGRQAAGKGRSNSGAPAPAPIATSGTLDVVLHFPARSGGGTGLPGAAVSFPTQDVSMRERRFA